MGVEVAVFELRHNLARGIDKLVFYRESLVYIIYIGADAHLSLAFVYRLCAEIATPRIDCCRVGIHHELYGTVQSATRIPSRTLLAVVEAHANLVLSFLQVWRSINTEGVISVSPVARQLTINIHMRVCHGSVKLHYSRLWQALQVDGSLVESPANPRQSARASRLLRLLLFAVLLYGNKLKIPLLVEGSVYRPVVRNGD